MKKFIYQAGIDRCILFGSLPVVAIAQPSLRLLPLLYQNTIATEDGDQTEIIIRQKGDKDTKSPWKSKTVNILSMENLWKNSTIRILSLKKEILMEIMMFPEYDLFPSPFRENPWNDDRDGKRSEQIMTKWQRKVQKSIQIRMNSAFLGVSSRKLKKEEPPYWK